jgi:exonuclease III
MIELKIAQYNMWNCKNAVMALLLRDMARKEIHILALQELWQNPYMNATYYPSRCGYWPVYFPNHWSRVCLLVSKVLPHSAWVFEHLQPDIVSVTLQLDDVIVHVHSIYSPSPGGLCRIEHDFPIFRILQLLQKPGEYVLVGNFNIYHPNWKRITYFDRHDMTDELIHITQQAGMQQLTSPGILI